MKTVMFSDNPLDPTAWESHNVEDVRDFLMSRYDVMPDTCRIYHQTIAQTHDVTPGDQFGIARLGSLEGPFYIVVYPAAPVTIALILGGVALAATIAAAIFLKPPKIPTPGEKGSSAASANNELAGRQNKPRPNERIPDIFGTVRSTPDLLTVPYRVFINHKEVEYAYMCIGRGDYDVYDIREGITPMGEITDSSVEIFKPFTSPNTHHGPSLRVGKPIYTRVHTVKRYETVNGQVLQSANVGYSPTKPTESIRFSTPSSSGGWKVQAYPESTVDFREIFRVGDELTIAGEAAYFGWYDSSGNYHNVNIAGTYTISEITVREISISNPSPNWQSMEPYPGYSAYKEKDITLSSSTLKKIGPFTVDVPDGGLLCFNFVAGRGLYKMSNATGAQETFDVIITTLVEKLDANGNPGEQSWNQQLLVGSSVLKDVRAVTIKTTPPFSGKCRVTAWRSTSTPFPYDGTVVDEIQWRDLYVIDERPVGEHYGNVTTVMSVTEAAKGTSALKDRKLNMLVTRKVPYRMGTKGAWASFWSSDKGTSRASDIIRAVCLDPYIGRRTESELDANNIYDTIAEVADYFGNPHAAEFNYTFDDKNMSFEETLATIADAVFCVAYRRGSQIKLSFEKKTTTSTLLFNHRNKIPGTETRTVRFGNFEEFDGVEFQYVDPKDDAIVTYSLPADMTATNPKKVESPGIRSRLQAHFHACRIWNKIRFQNVATEFEATQEADLLIIQDRILVADNTRPDTQDGEVTAQDGLTLTLSQPCVFQPGVTYTIFLQLPSGKIQSIPVTLVESDPVGKVLLRDPPIESLAVGFGLYARATYWLIGNNEPRATPFLVTEREPAENFTSKVTAINYDERYYANDSDYVYGVVVDPDEPVVTPPAPPAGQQLRYPAWSSTTVYGYGARVTYSGACYASMTSPNAGNNPALSPPTQWQKTTESVYIPV